MTVPSTSIASRLATGCRASLSHAQCRPDRADTRTRSVPNMAEPGNRRGHATVRISGPCLGHGDGMLEVGRHRAVGGDDRPVVRLDPGVVAAQGEHRLDGQAQAGLELAAGAAGAVVGDLRLLVHLGPDAVADELADDARGRRARRRPRPRPRCPRCGCPARPPRCRPSSPRGSGRSARRPRPADRRRRRSAPRRRASRRRSRRRRPRRSGRPGSSARPGCRGRSRRRSRCRRWPGTAGAG